MHSTLHHQVRVKPKSESIFASCSVDSDVKVWSLKSDPALLHTLDHHLGYVTSLVWIPDTDKENTSVSTARG